MLTRARYFEENKILAGKCGWQRIRWFYYKMKEKCAHGNRRQMCSENLLVSRFSEIYGCVDDDDDVVSRVLLQLIGCERSACRRRRLTHSISAINLRMSRCFVEVVPLYSIFTCAKANWASADWDSIQSTYVRWDSGPDTCPEPRTSTRNHYFVETLDSAVIWSDKSMSVVGATQNHAASVTAMTHASDSQHWFDAIKLKWYRLLWHELACIDFRVSFLIWVEWTLKKWHALNLARNQEYDSAYNTCMMHDIKYIRKVIEFRVRIISSSDWIFIPFLVQPVPTDKWSWTAAPWMSHVTETIWASWE